ncbi:MAG: YicC family protein [Eubacterium sp.]|nr:YicC family protein [Eubacterium sp.]
MIRSMTGFGRGEYRDEKRVITVELKSVNHRFSDINIKMPRRYTFAEEKIKAKVREYARRGKIDCSVMVDNVAESDVRITLNRPALEQYLNNLKAMKGEYSLSGDITLDLVASLPDVMRQMPEIEDQEEMTKCLLAAVEEAAKNLESTRMEEGARLAEDLLMRGKTVLGLAEKIEERSETVPAKYRDKLKARIEELLEGTGVELPEERLAVEVAVFADKCNITEEITRLKSHVEQLGSIIGSGRGAEGKELDFLIQEMNREANTIGSKANDLEVTNLMLKLKAEVEKIREQVQNIE